MKLLFAFLALSCGLIFSSHLFAEPRESLRPVLRAEQSFVIVQACSDPARKQGWKMAIAVFDHRATLVAYLKMDDVKRGNEEIAQRKGEAAAAYGRESKYWSNRALENPVYLEMPLFPAFEGGEPIYSSGGVLVGGVGVSGSSGSNDATCARIGIEAAGLSYVYPD